MRKDKDRNKQENPVTASNQNDSATSFDSTDIQEMIAAVFVLVPTLLEPPLFALGRVVATRGAVDLLTRLKVNGNAYLNRHQCGDWGAVCAEDATENVRAIMTCNRILSEYRLGGGRERLWIITEHDRSVTTLLLPEEY